MKILLQMQVATYVARDEVEIPDEKWAAMSEEARLQECEAYLEGHVSNSDDAWWDAWWKILRSAPEREKSS